MNIFIMTDFNMGKKVFGDEWDDFIEKKMSEVEALTDEQIDNIVKNSIEE